ncbi:hypothetical protein PILCRDRAFT_822656 [Piloderma croceum F 1598]|uniref:non-specific serine/threonine protein kinase n=1 Tax=Piloderma croceum (strain F 1598) TaxID=765440 RepID=A0A0C3FJU1_PILCF|nr:hypothetical protein PILCRDRAFT_822656 [Piloderma croceum F 1598]
MKRAVSTTNALNFSGQPTSQPLPVARLPSNGLQVKIADFGHANWTDWKFHNQAVALPTLPPEMLLGLPNAMTSAVDIWALGCMIFELLVGRWLFKRKGGEPSGAERTHLFCMMELTQQSIPNEMLELTPRRSELFDNQGKVRNVTAECSQTMHDALQTYNVLREADLHSTAAFIVRCLQLDPSRRPTAGQLLTDPWFES